MTKQNPEYKSYISDMMKVKRIPTTDVKLALKDKSFEVAVI